MNPDIPAPGSFLGRFLVKESHTIPELNLNAVLMQHEPTGARLLHLACDDPNNVFAVGFRTPPPDSTGIAHILEHTVLCGSRKYPVRDPFFAMLKRSLNTFMNALTAADWTLYPVASMNRKDFYNLVEIYLDATFFPLLREQDFLQEGHRLDFADRDDPATLMIKGVVFNEMKGAMADPSSLLNRRLNAALFPTTCYGENSGGEPLVIPQLTWDALRSFHRRYYHPSNSWIFTYGNLPLEDHLEKVETHALNHFTRQEVDSGIPLEKRFGEPLRTTRTFPIGASDDQRERSTVQMAWLTCPIDDTFERAATGILTNLLLGNPAAPLYQALIESGLGRNLSPGTGYHDDYRDTFIAAGLQGTDPERQDEIEKVIVDTLSRVAEQGFSQERVDAALHQYEFANREVTGDQYPYGLALMMRLFGPWLHAEDPFSTLRIESNLERLRAAAKDQDFFPAMIRRRLLENPHRVNLLLKPDPAHAQREEQAFAKHLETVRSGLSEEDISEIKAKNDKLQASQEQPEDMSCLPILKLSDIDAKEPAASFSSDSVCGCNAYWLPQPTNGITYLTLQFNVSDIDDARRPYLPLFCALLPQIGAGEHDYLAMSRRITAATGGIRLGSSISESPEDLDITRPVVEVKGKALDRNQGRLCDILTDMLTAPDFSDHNRLRTVINQVRTSMENSIPGAGHTFAARTAAASLTPAAAVREEWSGLPQLKVIQQASNLDSEGMAVLAETLASICGAIFNKANLSLAVTAEEPSLKSMSKPLQECVGALPEAAGNTQQSSWVFSQAATSTAWLHNLPVAYVARVFRTVPFTHPDAPALMVLAKLLRAEFLHREIREKGGAYGGMAGSNADGGLFSMLSYRDPHLARTLDVYRDAVSWASRGEFSDDMIKESILTSFAEMDRPLSPGSRGYREFAYLQQGKTHSMINRFRQGVLDTTPQKLSEVAAHYLEQALTESSTGILTGEEMYSQAQEVLSQLKTRVMRLG